MGDRAALRALLSKRLEGLRPRVATALKTLPDTAPPGDLRLIFEVQEEALTDVFPITPVVDASPGTDRRWYALQDLFRDLPAPLTDDDLHPFIVWEEGPCGPQEAIVQPVVDEAGLGQDVLLPWMAAVWAEAGLSNHPIHASAGLHDRPDTMLPLTRVAAGQGAPRRLRNPLISREGPPVSLSVRAARWGALAVLLGGVVLAVPIYRGWAAAEARIAATPSICGTSPALPSGPEGASLHDRLVQFFIETCEVTE